MAFHSTDGIPLFSTIRMEQDCNSLQQTNDNLNPVKNWQLTFSYEKCEFLCVTKSHCKRFIGDKFNILKHQLFKQHTAIISYTKKQSYKLHS